MRDPKRGARTRQLVLTWRPYDASISLDDRDIFLYDSQVNCGFSSKHNDNNNDDDRQASRVWDVLLVYSNHFLQSRFTSAKHDTTGTTSKTRSMQTFIGRQIYLPPLHLLLLLFLSLPPWLTPSELFHTRSFLLNLCPSLPSSHALFLTHVRAHTHAHTDTLPFFSHLWHFLSAFLFLGRCREIFG